MPTPRELPQEMPNPQAKARMQKPQGGGKCLVQIPGGALERMVMDEIDTCITPDGVKIYGQHLLLETSLIF